MIKVAIVDDHVIVRSGFTQLLSLESDINVVGQYGSVEDAKKGLLTHQADVCICDISMPDVSGFALLDSLPSGLACIMLSVHDSPAMVEKALEAGALGYLTKRCSPEELIQAVRTAAQGGCYLTPDIALKLTSPKKENAPLHLLTKREKQVCELIATGLEVKVVACQLGLSPKTVHVHRANAMDKLAVKNNVELAKLFNQALPF
ncbi:transcriptional regulator UhpA [Vibrio ostreicida]|uniref:Transcriptional regulatory protein UhpA n=1 Tax=Vibrio ostreicida TaxID=526588 RepID=A0ABT8BXG1_9VIBR|nr:transcriptional regulator UhpA [Vibrio ostreicida]MDN3611867.1 transcriptional regulator UhpA [Vibrio ostreicida]NPD09673.1 transcriptional regulator UhpA [Vibrio ostreicida]